MPKAGKQKQFIKWLPISLLNDAFNIASRCIAKRIKSLLDILINKDKTSLTIGRFIGENMTHI